MAVSQMQRAQIFAHSSHRASLIKDLQDLEIIHINNLNEQEGSTDKAPTENEVRTIIRGIQNDLSRLQSIISYLADFEQKKGFLSGFLGGNKIVLSSQEYANIANETDHSEWRDICDECQSLEERTVKLTSREGRLNSDKEHLLLWSDLDAPVEEIRDTEKMAIRIGVVPVSTYDELLAGLNSSEVEVAFETVGQTKTDIHLVVMFLKEDEQKASALLTRYGFSPVSLPLTSGTVADQLKRIDEELLEISSQRKEIAEKSAQLAVHRAKLMTIYDHLTELLRQEEIRESFAHTEYTFMVDGWVRKRDIKGLEDRLSKKYEELGIVVSEPSEGDEPPVELENKRLFSPFQMVTRLYGLPNYGKTDPSPLLAPFFAFSLGICLTDAGYGFLVVLIAYFISKRMSGSGKELFRLLMIAGFTTMLIGLLTGGWFGISSEKLPSFLTEIRLFDPINDQMTFIAVVLAIGFVQVWFGFFVKMQIYLKERDWIGAFCEQFPWLLAMVLLPVTVVLYKMEGMSVATQTSLAATLLCLLTIAIFAGRANKNPAVRLAAGLFDLYGKISGTFGDILSYMRLFALGLSSGILAGVVNTMAGIMWGNPVGKVAAIGLLIGGHAFNLVMSCLGGFIHTTRLQFVEFFTKFYESGGKEFQPFRKEHTYITVVENP